MCKVSAIQGMEKRVIAGPGNYQSGGGYGRCLHDSPLLHVVLPDACLRTAGIPPQDTREGTDSRLEQTEDSAETTAVVTRTAAGEASVPLVETSSSSIMCPSEWVPAVVVLLLQQQEQWIFSCW